MKLKKVTALALTFIMALSVAACGGKTEEPAAPADTAPAADAEAPADTDANADT